MFTASRSVSLESTTSSKERKNGSREKASLQKQPEDTENGTQTTEEVSTKEQEEDQLTVKGTQLTYPRRFRILKYHVRCTRKGK